MAKAPLDRYLSEIYGVTFHNGKVSQIEENFWMVPKVKFLQIVDEHPNLCVDDGIGMTVLVKDDMNFLIGTLNFNTGVVFEGEFLRTTFGSAEFIRVVKAPKLLIRRTNLHTLLSPLEIEKVAEGICAKIGGVE